MRNSRGLGLVGLVGLAGLVGLVGCVTGSADPVASYGASAGSDGGATAGTEAIQAATSVPTDDTDGGSGGGLASSTGPTVEGGSRCQVSAAHVACERETTAFQGGTLFWQVPTGTAPAQGWPVVILFHGSFFGPENLWQGGPELPYGGFHQLRVQAALLDNGFALFTPEATAGVAWATNFPPGPAADVTYLASGDHELMQGLFVALEAGEFGAMDMTRLYATGISSGGYMTSRMAQTYPGRFRALAIQSGSYATCSNLLCAVPSPQPSDHPPTLFLHGQLDLVVPISTMLDYAQQLGSQGLIHAEVIDPSGSHAWIGQSPQELVAWFEQHS